MPAGTQIVQVRRPGYSAGTQDIAATGTTVVTVYEDRLQSPEYGVNTQRTRYNPAVRAPVAGGTPAWRFDTKRLAEFPPAVKNGILIVGTNSGRVYGVNAHTGKQLWTQFRKGKIASSPAIGGRRVYVTSMDGTFTAYRVRTGTRLWEYNNGGSPIESSPLIIDDTAYYGAWNGTLYAVSLRTGKVRWTAQAGGAIKGSAAQWGGNVIVGDYGGSLMAVNARTGHVVWRTHVGSRLYGGPGVSDGRIVIGDVGGQVICVSAASGRVLWRTPTGGYVYSSPAIADGTVFIGAYDGVFRALRLSDGSSKWSFNAGGRISGSATVVGDTVYTAVLAAPGQPRHTWGLSTATGAVRYRGQDGRYSPAVAAGRTLYIVGVHTIDAYRASG